MAISAKNNPFTAGKVEQIRYRHSFLTIDMICEKLSSNACTGEIAGPHGSGKTTLMLELAKRLEADGRFVKHVFINDTTPLTTRDRKKLPETLDSSHVVLLDGADHLSRFAWQSLKRNILKTGAGLIITTHKPGMLETIVESSTSAELLTELINELIDHSDRPDKQLINDIYNRHNGNIRNCLWYLYDIWAENGKLN